MSPGKTNLTLADLRPEVAAFALLMEAKLRKNDHKTGWKHHTSRALFNRLTEEALELIEAIKAGRSAGVVGEEAADVANFAMMIADVCGALDLHIGHDTARLHRMGMSPDDVRRWLRGGAP